MSNRFCIILNEGNQLLSIVSDAEDKVYKLKQGCLFIGNDTPYSTFTMNNESWHIIGHIENLPLLNYLLFSYYPSHHDLINKEIICLAVKRYGMKIIELLQGNFCIIYEDCEGNLTLVTEDGAHRNKPAIKDSGEAAYRGDSARTSLSAAGAKGTKPAVAAFLNNTETENCFISAPSADAACWHDPYETGINQYRISLTRWHDHHLQFIQSFRWPPIPHAHESKNNFPGRLSHEQESSSLSSN